MVQRAKKVTFVADADIDADGANGQNDARAAFMADDSGSEALANGGMGIRHGEVVGIADWFKDIVVIENGKPKIFPGGIIVSKLLTTSAANRRIPQNGTLILRLSPMSLSPLLSSRKLKESSAAALLG